MGDNFIRSNNLSNAKGLILLKHNINESDRRCDEKLEKFEKKLKNDPQYLIEYASDIFDYLKKSESVNIPTFDLNTIKIEITQKMRAVLVDWIIFIHSKFELLPETLFLSVNLFDRFLSKQNLETDNFHLLGIAAVLVASKFEEIYPPEIRDFIYMSEKAITKNEIIEMEYKILSALNFDILFTSSFRFLERYHFVSNDNTGGNTLYLAQYLLELCLMEFKMLSYPQSLLAATAIFVARKLFKVDANNTWNNTLELNTGYKEKDLVPCFKDICKLIWLVPKISLKNCYIKFSSSTYNKVAKYLDNKTTLINNVTD